MNVEDFGYTHVQLVGGNADGMEIAIDRLYPELRFNVATYYQYADWLNPEKKKAVYYQIPDTTIYVFKRIE